MNSRFDNNEAAVLWEQIALDVKTGVEFLKRQGRAHGRAVWTERRRRDAELRPGRRREGHDVLRRAGEADSAGRS